MKPIRTVSGTMAPLPRAQVDTDQIIPKQFLKRIERTGFGEFLFFDWAHDADGEKNPEFVLNRPEHQTATVLVAGPDFGTGSSREHAPWALDDRGFKAVIAPSFGDIFRANCLKIGLLAVELAEQAVAALLALAADHPDALVTVNLESQRVAASGVDEVFEIEPFTRHMLLNGWDEIGMTLLEEEAIVGYEARRHPFKPSLSDER